MLEGGELKGKRSTMILDFIVSRYFVITKKFSPPILVNLVNVSWKKKKCKDIKDKNTINEKIVS